MPEWDEQTGIAELDDASDPLQMFRKRRGLSDLLYRTGDNAQPEAMPSYAGEEETKPEPLANRIQDDNQTGNRSGGPAGGYQKPPTPYVDPGAGRLKDLMRQEQAASQPAAKPSFGHRLLNAVMDAGPTALAAGVGGMGAAQGADSAMQEGVQRRHQQQDLAESQRQDKLKNLRQQIQDEQKAAEQRQFTHGEDQNRIEEQERGLNAREKMAQEAETGRNQRLIETIKGQGSRQQAGFEHADDVQENKFRHDEEMEDQKQTGRMALQMARARAQAAIARMRSTMKSIPGPVAKSFDSFEDSQSRIDVMSDAYEKGLRGDQQAMLNMLANHLGMTMSLQKGARLNQAIIEEAYKSGYLSERIEAHFDKDGYMTGVVLTPRQMSQMLELAKVRVAEDARKVTDMETYFGVRGGMAATPKIPGGSSSAPGAGGTGDGTGAPASGSSGELKPPGPAHQGMKWQHRIVNGKIEWRMVQDKQ